MLSRAELKTSVTLSVVISVVINILVLSVSFMVHNPSKTTLEEDEPLNRAVRGSSAQLRYNWASDALNGGNNRGSGNGANNGVNNIGHDRNGNGNSGSGNGNGNGNDNHGSGNGNYDGDNNGANNVANIGNHNGGNNGNNNGVNNIGHDRNGNDNSGSGNGNGNGNGNHGSVNGNYDGDNNGVNNGANIGDHNGANNGNNNGANNGANIGNHNGGNNGNNNGANNGANIGNHNGGNNGNNNGVNNIGHDRNGNDNSGSGNGSGNGNGNHGSGNGNGNGGSNNWNRYNEHTRTDSHRAAVQSVFVRWGRRTCPSNGAGVTAIAQAHGKAVVLNHGSASSDMLCLMQDNDIRGRPFSSGPSATPVVFKNGIKHYELPCALCYCTTNVVVTFTGWNDCPAGESGWSMIYKGWVMTGDGAPARSLSGAHCVDENIETRYLSSSASTAFTLVRASKSHKKIPCVVCGRS